MDPFIYPPKATAPSDWLQGLRDLSMTCTTLRDLGSSEHVAEVEYLPVLRELLIQLS